MIHPASFHPYPESERFTLINPILYSSNNTLIDHIAYYFNVKNTKDEITFLNGNDKSGTDTYEEQVFKFVNTNGSAVKVRYTLFYSKNNNINFKYRHWKAVLALVWTINIPKPVLVSELRNLLVKYKSYYAVHKLNMFLSFINDHLQFEVLECLSRIYDDQTYCQNLIDQLAINVDLISDFRSKLVSYIKNGKSIAKHVPKPQHPTIKPPTLTCAQVRYRPQSPIIIPTTTKALPIPAKLYDKGHVVKEHAADSKRALSRLEQHARNNQKRCKNKSSTAIKSPPPVLFETTPPPKIRHKTINAPPALIPRPTVSTIARESAILQKREKEAKHQHAFALTGLVDLDSTKERELACIRAQAQQVITQRERMKLQVQLAREEAGLKREEVVLDNFVIANQVKTQLQKDIENLEQIKHEQELMNKTKIDIVQQIHKQASDAKQNVHVQNRMLVEKACMESKQLKQQVVIQQEQELQMRKLLVQQIRQKSDQLVHAGTPTKDVPTLGLLNEMSMAELKQSLNTVKAMHQELEFMNRQRIMQHKEEQGRMLKSKLEYIQESKRLAKCIENPQHSAIDTIDNSPIDQELEEMKLQLERKRLEKQAMITANHASPHRYRVHIKKRTFPKPTCISTSPRSISLPDINANRYTNDPKSHQIFQPRVLSRKFPSDPTLIPCLGTDACVTRKLVGKELTNAIALVLGIDKVI